MLDLCITEAVLLLGPLMASHFVMAAFASRGQLLLPLLVNLFSEMPWCALSQYHQHMHLDSKSTCFCKMYRLLHPFPALAFGDCRRTVAERVLPVPVCEGMRVGETMGTHRGFYKVWVLQLPRYSLERFPMGLTGALLCFPLPCMLQGPGWRKDGQRDCMVSLQ